MTGELDEPTNQNIPRNRKYREGKSYADFVQLRRKRREIALRIMACFDPLRSCAQIGRELGISKQAIHAELERIFYKIAIRMMDDNFKP